MRGLSGGEIAVLQSSTNYVEEHLRLTTRTANPIGATYSWITATTYRFTTGNSETVVASDGTYIPQSYISSLAYSEEGYELAPATLSLVFETLDQSFVNALTTDNAFSTIVDVWKVFKNISTHAVEARFPLFNGLVTGIDITGNEQTQVLTLRASSNFSQLDRVGGRTIADLPQQRIFETIFWGALKI